MQSAEDYAALVDAWQAQGGRVASPTGDRWAARAAAFRLEPRRELEANTAAIVALVDPNDSVVDIGGGAGRVGLPVALRCRDLLNIEPSAGMRQEFEASASEAGVQNARCLAGSWPEGAAGIEADVIMLANVTYFVRDIVPFIEALQRAARRRAIIGVWSVPPPNHTASLFELLHNEPQALAPTHRDLLPVLWDLGILPDVQVLPDPFRGARERPPTHEEAVLFALERGSANQVPGAASVVETHFDELFAVSPQGFVPKWQPAVREMLITWTTR
jgi:hypothetical protein